MTFKVIDKKTNQEADVYKIALKEKWANSLCYCDMEGFAITEDGTLILADECGKFEFCPEDRFEIISENEKPKITNADKLRAMSDEELADIFTHETYRYKRNFSCCILDKVCSHEDCYECFLNWLKKEAK